MNNTLPTESNFGGLELTVINNQNHNQYDSLLRGAREFLAGRYPPGVVISYNHSKGQLAMPSKDGLVWLVKTNNDDGNIEGVAVLEVFDVPKSPSKRKLMPDGQHQYTSLYYAAVADPGLEPELKKLVDAAVSIGVDYSTRNGRKNIGMVTDDSRHLEVLKQMGFKYLDKMDVPTLDDISDADYLKANFKKDHTEKILVLPKEGIEWSKVMAPRVGAMYLDRAYNDREPDDPTYKPLTRSTMFQNFLNTMKSSTVLIACKKMLVRWCPQGARPKIWQSNI